MVLIYLRFSPVPSLSFFTLFNENLGNQVQAAVDQLIELSKKKEKKVLDKWLDPKRPTGRGEDCPYIKAKNLEIER